jgi:cell wall-associated NlpC family hydrolase
VKKNKEWEWKNAGFSLIVSVHEQHPNRPYYFQRRSNTEHFEIHFLHFEDKKANSSWFDVPSECKNATELTDVTLPLKESPLVATGVRPVDGVCVAAVNNAITIAKQDCPYIYGGNGPCGQGYDNDGLIASAFASAGVFVPRLVSEQQENGNGCSGGVQLGDLIFQGSPATHVAIVIGNGMVAECPLDGHSCRLSDVDFNTFNGGCRRYC